MGQKTSQEIFNELFNTAYRSLKVAVAVHSEIHAGDHFFVEDYDSDVDTGVAKYWHLVVPDTAVEFHMAFQLEGTLPGLVELYEAPTTSANGTALTAYNSNRNHSGTATLSVYKDPTASADGTRLRVGVIGTDGTNPNGGGSVGGGAERENELMLKRNTAYLVKFTPESNDTRVSIQIEWYEVS